MIDEDFDRALRKERRDARRAGRAFARACAVGDVDAVQALAHVLGEETVGGWEQAFRFLPEVVHPDVHAAFLPIWIENKSIAASFASTRPVLEALRRLIRPYDGLTVTLYRGEARNRRRRSEIGISWTSDLNTAEKFATDARQCIEGGSVVLRAVAPPEAIVSHLRGDEDHYGEAEFFVDPRLLGRIRVHHAFPQLTPAAHIARLREWHAPRS